MYEEQIESVMRGALLSASKGNNISLQDLRIKMRLTESQDSTECITLNKTEEIGELTWSKVLGLKVVLKSMIVGTITKMLTKLSEENSIDKSEVNVIGLEGMSREQLEKRLDELERKIGEGKNIIDAEAEIVETIKES